MRQSPKNCTAFLTLLLATSFTFSQTDACRNRTVMVNVRDPQGRLMSGLLPKNFEAKFRGQPVKVVSAGESKAPGRVILLVDASGSISTNAHTWEIARLVAADLISAPSSPHQVALVVFATNIVEKLDFGTSREQILERIRQMQDGTSVVPKGERRTGFYDATLNATKLFGAPTSGDAIFAITDGGDNQSHASKDDVVKDLLRRNVRFFAFYLTEIYFPTEEVQSSQEVLRNLTQLTGGALLNIPGTGVGPLYDLSPKGRERMASQLSYLYDLIAHSYQLQIELPTSVDKKRGWDLKVVDDQGQEQKKLTLFYPQELMPCDAASGHP